MAIIYCYLIAVTPILLLYGIPAIPQISMTDWCWVLFCIVVVVGCLRKRETIAIQSPFAALTIYLLIQPILLCVYATQPIDTVDAVGTAWKLALCYGILTVFAGQYANQAYMEKGIRFVGVLSSIYGLLQYILANYMGVSLSVYLPLLPVTRAGLNAQQEGWIFHGMNVRSRAWFSEPATYSIYLLLAIYMELYVNKRSKKTAKLILLYIIALVFAGSSTGYIGLLILLGIYTLQRLRTKKKRIITNLVISAFTALPIALFLLYQTGIIERFLNHTFAHGQGIQAQSHFRDISDAFAQSASVLEVLFGRGMQDIQEYLPGWIRAYHVLGIVGVMLFVWIFYKMFKSGNRAQRTLVLLFAILNVGTEVMMGHYSLLYFSVIMMGHKNLDSA